MRTTTALVAAATVSAIAAAAALALVVAKSTRLPAPTGPWPVGTSVIALGPPGRNAIRDARVWYPAARRGGGSPAAYLHGTRGAGPRSRLVAALVRTDARVDVALRDGRSPVIIYVPGMGGRRIDNTALAQDAASHGYVVVALDDSRPDLVLDFATDGAVARARVDGDRKVRLQTRDARAVLDALAVLDRAPTGPLAHRLDLDRVGALGYSFGGAVAAELAATDARVRAAVDLDGAIFGSAARTGAGAPLLFITSTHERVTPAEAAFDRENLERIRAGLRRHGGAFVTIADMEHGNFSDAAVLPTFRRTGLGRIDRARGERVVAHYVLAFFDRTLGRAHEPLLAAEPAYADVARLDLYARSK